ncbi:hypothetical protein FRC17_009029 [Serendipita sp. 399]|nr:hypothetical protein FRC17_009029 [Serendipita sp. 399]
MMEEISVADCSLFLSGSFLENEDVQDQPILGTGAYDLQPPFHSQDMATEKESVNLQKTSALWLDGLNAQLDEADRQSTFIIGLWDENRGPLEPMAMIPVTFDDSSLSAFVDEQLHALVIDSRPLLPSRKQRVDRLIRHHWNE